jgi:UDPglucose 6-dehydrogenase
MQIKSLTLYGYGYVGRSVNQFFGVNQFARPCRVNIVDPALRMEETEESKANHYAIICVPTPMLPDGQCDTAIVESIIEQQSHLSYLIKSTIPPTTTERLAFRYPQADFTFSPEYVGEGRYQVPYWEGYPHPTDMRLHNFFIFGGAPFARKEEAVAPWVELWQRVAGWAPHYGITDSTTAELAKYTENTFLACKKIFCDELYEACRSFGVNYNELRELWLMDKRMGPAMTLIYPDNRGFDGKCLPKDTAAIVYALQMRGYDPKFWLSIIENNKRFRKE